MSKRARKILYSVVLVAVSSLACILFVEIFLRSIVNGRLEVFAVILRRPELYASWFEEDYWKLHVKMNGRYKPPKNPHPLLGWIGKFDRTTLIHNHTSEVGQRRPVLLYGDSFAACVTKEKFQDLLNENSDFSDKYYLLNYGVGGYGLGQIFLLLKNTVHLYEKPIVVLSCMTNDLDRSVMSFRTGQKPSFRVIKGVVQNSTMPIYEDPYGFLAQNPPQIRSYLLAGLSRLLFRAMPRVFRHTQNFEEVKAVNTYLIRESISILRAHRVPFIVVVFHHFNEDAVTIFDSRSSWRSEAIYDTLTDLQVPYISTKNLIQSDAELKGRQLRSDYFLYNDGHPNAHYNRLVANEIKQFALRQTDVDDNTIDIKRINQTSD